MSVSLGYTVLDHLKNFPKETVKSILTLDWGRISNDFWNGCNNTLAISYNIFLQSATINSR